MPMPLSVSELPDVMVKPYCGAPVVNNNVPAVAAVSMVTDVCDAEAPNVATVSAGVELGDDGIWPPDQLPPSLQFHAVGDKVDAPVQAVPAVSPNLTLPTVL